MEQIKQALSEIWGDNPEMHDLKHCVYQETKLKEIENSYFCNKKLSLAENEEIYLIVHGNFSFFPGWKAGGFALTNFGLHFDTHKDGFLSTLLFIPQDKNGFLKYDDINSLQIAEHDCCFGTDYIGHNLIINDEKYGLVRMAKGIIYDEKLIKYCNNVFSKLVGVCLNSPPNLDLYPDTII